MSDPIATTPGAYYTNCDDCNSLTAGRCWRHTPSSYGMVTKVRTDQGTYGLSWVMPVCDLCGALLVDQQRHDDWHDRLEEA